MKIKVLLKNNPDKFSLLKWICGLLICILFSCNQSIDNVELEEIFHLPPDSIQMSTYWSWMSDNISREGVINDLKAMKEIGITRTFISNIGLDGLFGIPFGNVELLSDEWWEITHTALKTATELGIEVGIFDCPGWSQSGGPWIKPEQSMRYLASTEVLLTGPEKISRKLTSPDEGFEDVKVLAFRIPKEFGKKLTAENLKISSIPHVKYINHIADGCMDTEVVLPSDQPLIIDFETTDPLTIRSILIHPAERPVSLNCEFLVKEGDSFISVKNFVIDRINPRMQVGFHPYGAASISVPPTPSRFFRLIISEAVPRSGIREVEFFVSPRVESYIEKSLGKMFPEPLPPWNYYKWPQQPETDDPDMVIDPSGILDISGFMSEDGTLNWDVPEGEWLIMRSGMLSTGVTNNPSTPAGRGLEVDKMSVQHIQHHFDSFLGEIIRRVPPEDRKTWKVVVVESWEVGSQNWTDGFIEMFKNHYGYDPTPYIPVLNGYVVGNRDISDRFLWDLRRIVADKVAYNYMGGLREISNAHGMTVWLQNFGHWGFPGEFLQYGGQAEETCGEFWTDRYLGNVENRLASSAAHIYGKNKVSSESFTSGRMPYFDYPARMKQRADRFFTEGINNTHLVTFIQQPYDDKKPGVNCWFGSEFNRHNTWFYQLDMFLDYLKRTNFMLQQGTYVADAAYFIGEDAPVMAGICEPELPQGYSFDYINAEVLLTRVSVKNGKLVLPDGMSYSILVLPKLETIRPELLRKIRDLVHRGAVVLGPPPQRSPSLENYPVADQEVRSLAAELWNGVDGIHTKYARFGKGMVLSGMNMQEAFDLIHVIPDCKLAPEDPVLFIHRTLRDKDIYFLTNQSNKIITIYPEFRIQGKAPELWDPISGSIRELPAYTQKEKTTIVPLQLEPDESAFIIFRKKAGPAFSNELHVNFPDSDVLHELKGPWKVIFDPGQRGPAQPVIFEELSDWSKRTEDSIRYYSGKAVYHNTFEIKELPEKGRIFLDLGNLVAIARIRVNGKEAGGAWIAPWRVDVTNMVKSGNNMLEIEVVNTWANRLIGDHQLPEKDRKTWTYINWYTQEEQLESSGLLGPVTIQTIPYEGYYIKK